ncbi:hypothetical protein HU200_041011 [Digitaria exilis]|uniref:Uncharacterized protein n=1 Tax=Digitaria exilis TaxID=1010633 RepID=A0A835B9M4_9POAL|nr:hypothetical protein HU200_041011 [Digitaria exilis]
MEHGYGPATVLAIGTANPSPRIISPRVPTAARGAAGALQPPLLAPYAGNQRPAHPS